MRPSTALFALSMVGAALGCGGSPSAVSVSDREPLSVAEMLGSTDIDGYSQALEPREFSFPLDHGPHPDFKTEWWYWTGHLRDKVGRQFGYQLTFFRAALAPPATKVSQPASEWRSDQLYMAHFAVTSIETGTFHSFERFARGAAGLAGASAAPFRVWLEDWSAVGEDPIAGVRLQARQDNVSIDLELAAGKPPALHGQSGLSRKGPLPGAASYYYSLPRNRTSGQLQLDGESFEVTGHSWLDREWSTSILGADEVGWDWLGAQLDDGRELMLFRLRKDDGSTTWSGGSLITPNGAARPLQTEGLRVDVVESWTSEVTGITYPSRLEIELPAEPASLVVEAAVEDQELRGSFVYWEGVVRVAGRVGIENANGLGYLELTGYGDSTPRGASQAALDP